MTTTNLISLLSLHLPIELTNLILEFFGYHKFRNGQYLKQIDMSSRLIDRLYRGLLLRPRMKDGFVILRFTDDNCIALFQTTYYIYSDFNGFCPRL
jgi:hypothetical protein